MRLTAEGMKSFWASVGFVSRTPLEQKWNPDEVPVEEMVRWMKVIAQAEKACVGEFDLHFELRPEGTRIDFDHHGCLHVQSTLPKRVEMLATVVNEA